MGEWSEKGAGFLVFVRRFVPIKSSSTCLVKGDLSFPKSDPFSEGR